MIVATASLLIADLAGVVARRAQQREGWLASCEHDFVPYPMFALLLYMLEFSVDRNYNPKTGKTERPPSKTHKDECTVCSKAGQLLCCDKCPKVYHM